MESSLMRNVFKLFNFAHINQGVTGTSSLAQAFTRTLCRGDNKIIYQTLWSLTLLQVGHD